MKKGSLVLVAVAGFFCLVFGYVTWMDRDLISAERRAADLALLFGSTLGGLMLASVAWNILLAPATKVEPRHRWKWAAAAAVVFLGILAGLPWMIRAAWGYRTALVAATATLGAILLVLLLLLIAIFRRGRAAR